MVPDGAAATREAIPPALGGHRVERDLRLPTGQPGLSLSADLYRPLVDHPVPALVTLGPYGKDFVAGAGAEGPARWFADHGYASLVVDLLGTGASDGRRRPEFDPGDGDDAIAAIEWVAAQPWCTGAVGLWGLSYAATVAYRAASRQPPALRAIIAIAHGLDPGRASVHPDGLRGDLHALVNRGSSLLLQQLLPPLYGYADPARRRRWRQRLAELEPAFLDYAGHGPGDPVWSRRAVDGPSIVVPALCVGGWRDAFLDGLVDAYRRIAGPKRLLVGDWGHVLPHESTVGPVDFLPLALDWWDRWLLDKVVPVEESPVTAFVAGAGGGWLDLPSWPPPGSTLVLATAGRPVLTGPPRDPAGDVDRPWPARPIGRYEPDPTVGSLRGLPGLGLGEQVPAQDQHDDDARCFVADSEPLEVSLIIGGQPSVRIRVPSRPPARLVVRLSEVDDLGRSTLVTMGVLRVTGAGPEHQLALRPTLRHITAGLRLRLAIGDSDFPRLNPLVDPVGFDVDRVELSLPLVVGPLPGRAAAVVPSTGLAQRPSYTVSRDIGNDELTVAYAGETPELLSPDGHRYRVVNRLRAVVRRDAPEAAVAEGRQEAEVTLTTGEVVRAVATVRTTQTGLWGRGEVRLDGTLLFARDWQVALGPADLKV